MTDTTLTLARDSWLKASHFHPLDQKAVLDAISEAVKQTLAKDGRARVIFDLDSTLYDVGPRTLAILKDWADYDRRHLAPDTAEALTKIERGHVGYSLRDTFSLLGLDIARPEIESDIRSAGAYWWDRFFSNDYLGHDVPSPGAVAYANLVKDLGAEVVYLTGRMAPEMAKGTRRNLERDGFPVAPGSSRLMMKDSPDRPDLEHKVEAVRALGQDVTVVASFENEPLNLMAMREALPAPMHVFVNTVCSDHPAPLGRDLYCIRDFSHV